MALPDHIFIVGLGRTGSTLTREILNCSPFIGIGGESHFFRDLPRVGFQSSRSFRRKMATIGDLSTDAGAEKVTDFLYTSHQKHFTFWKFQKKNIRREEFLRQLLASDRSERAFFDLAMGVHAEGKPIRGEKTPAHIFYVPTLLEWYPNAKVIHTFRDPRAIFTSRKKKAEKKQKTLFGAILRKTGLAFEMISSLHVIHNWKQVAKLHRQFQSQYPDRYYLLKYEDLIGNPQNSLQSLCDFLGINLSEEMLDQKTINSSYLPDGASGFDRSAVDRWREHLDPFLNRWFVLWCKQDLVEFGYPI